MDTSGKILFNCPSCGYRAKIPGNYLGMSIRCPGCNGAQTVVKPTEKSAESTGKTVSITRVATTPLPFTIDEAKQAPASAPGAATRTPLPGSLNVVAPPSTPANQAQPSGANPADTLLFSCAACAYRARIPSSYAGRTILCPKCSAAQAAPALNAPQPPSTGNTVRISRIATTTTPAAGTPALPPVASAPAAATMMDSGLAVPDRTKHSSAPLEISDKILFTCASCGMRARIPARYAGNTIKCPKCSKPGTVPLSDAVEAATGTTVSISRVDVTAQALNSPAKRPSGEIAMPPAAPASAASKQPSGELELDLGLPSPAAAPAAKAAESSLPPADASPFQGQAVIGTLPTVAEIDVSSDDLLEDLRGQAKVDPTARKGGVVKRRGSSSSLPQQSAASPPAKAPAGKPPAPAGKAAVGKGSPASAPTPVPKTPPPLDDDEAAAAPAAKNDSKSSLGAAKKPARGGSREGSAAPASSGASPKARGSMLPIILIALSVVLLIASVGLYMAWSGAKAERADLEGKLTTANASLADMKKRAEKADAENLALTGKLDDAKKDAETQKEKSDKLAQDTADLKKSLETKQADFDKQLAELQAQVAEQKRQIEAAAQGIKNTKGK